MTHKCHHIKILSLYDDFQSETVAAKFVQGKKRNFVFAIEHASNLLAWDKNSENYHHLHDQHHRH